MRYFKRALLFVLVMFFCLSNISYGLMYWTEYEFNDVQQSSFDRPDEKCLARIVAGSVSATCTVIDPNFIITAAHWTGHTVVGRTVYVGEDTDTKYIIAQLKRGDYVGGLGVPYSPDIAICKIKKVINPNTSFPSGYDYINDPNGWLEDANLSSWIDLYDKDCESGSEVIIGGFGPIRTGVFYDSDPITNYGGYRDIFWGRNIISSVNSGSSEMDIAYDAVGTEGYIKYETKGGDTDSGSGWFIKDVYEWKLAGMFKSPTLSLQLSSYVDWIDGKIAEMGNQRIKPIIADVNWNGGEQDDWALSSNWVKNRTPILNDIVAIDNLTTALLSSGEYNIHKLLLGVDNGGSLFQNGGVLNVQRDVYIGGQDLIQGEYKISCGSLISGSISVGCGGGGLLQIDNSSANITTQILSFGPNAFFMADANSVIQLSASSESHGLDFDTNGNFHLSEDVNSVSLSGLDSLTLQCTSSEENAYKTVIIEIEVAGANTDMPIATSFSMDNFIINRLIVGCNPEDINDIAGKVSVKLVDDYNNCGNNEIVNHEAMFVNNLEIKAGGTFEVDETTGEMPFKLFYLNNGNPKQFLMGDINLDGIVDSIDLATCISNENLSGASWSDGDVNGDRLVNTYDTQIVTKAMTSAKGVWPPDGATVRRGGELLLSWIPPTEAISHNVYLGTDPNDVFEADMLSPEYMGSYEVGEYNPGSTIGRIKTYYWRVDEVDPNSKIIKGDVWSFTYAPENTVHNITNNTYFDSVKEAVEDVNTVDGDVIILDRETYFELPVNYYGKEITIQSKDPYDWDTISNTIVRNNLGGVFIFNDGTTKTSILSGVTVTGEGAAALGIIFESSGKISNCIIKDLAIGVGCSGSGSPHINNCFIVGNSVYGIVFDSVSDIALITNNTLVNNTIGLLFIDGVLPEISNCIIWDNNDDLSGCYATYSCISDGDSGIGNITGESNEPQFIDPNNGDYHLKGSSPCIDSGDPNMVIDPNECDIDGESRILGKILNTIDMGADEVGCLSIKDSNHTYWVQMGSPDCWCYQRQCYGDIDGEMLYDWYPVSQSDLSIFTNSYLKSFEELPEGGVCCDLDHKSLYGYYPVSGSDLEIISDYYMLGYNNVPICEEEVDINFWKN